MTTDDQQQPQQPEAQPAPAPTVFPFPFGSIFSDVSDLSASSAEPEQE